MAFGQASGPPARAKQLEELLSLLREAGHDDFRDARGPMGFTQRQAAGKFTHDEAAAFIDSLVEARDRGEFNGDATPVEPHAVDRPPVVAPRRAVKPPRASTPDDKLSAAEQTLRRFPSPMLAAELQRRGWVVMEP